MKKNFKLLLLTLIMGGGFFASEAMADGLQQINGVYQIGTADDFEAFAKLINEGNSNPMKLNAVLTADIDLRSKGNCMIGTIGHTYGGEFDGQGHTITIDYKHDTSLDMDEGELGLIRRLRDGTVKNLLVNGNITTCNKCAGGIVSGIWYTGTIENCVSNVTITDSGSGDATHGGILARISNKSNITIKNCAFYGTIEASNREGSGGIIGWADYGNSENKTETKIINCVMGGTLHLKTGNDINNDVFVRNNVSITNSYYVAQQDMNNTNNTSVSQKDLNALKNALGSDWSEIYNGAAPLPNQFVPTININYYELSTASHMRQFAELVNSGQGNVNGKMMNDINLSNIWTPIGQNLKDFAGHFNGQNHRIKNLDLSGNLNSYGNQALFGQVVGSAVIENVIMDASCTIKGNGSVAGILGTVWGDGATLNNCTNEATIESNGNGVGGIVGSTHKKVIINNCINKGSIKGAEHVGGILGYVDDGPETAISNCTNETNATIEATTKHAGGIVGTTNKKITISSCTNKGEIKGPVTIAGIIARSWGSSGSTISDCKNEGTITCNGNEAGGIMGASNVGLTITNCINESTISGKDKTGGIFGVCYGEGVIIEYCINKQTVNGSNRTAGILGSNECNGLIISNCGNEGNITGTGANAAGIVGCSTTKVGILRCYNTGAVKGDKENAGICAWMGADESTLDYCYNIGTVENTGTDDDNATNTLWRYNKDLPSHKNNYFLVKIREEQSATQIEDGWLTSGELCYKLNDSSSDNPSWYQTLGTDNYPVPFNSHDVVFYDNSTYINNNTFELETADDVKWFAEYVNAGHPDINAKLTADIDFGAKNETPITPIGTDAYKYGGTFDGQSHKILNMVINAGVKEQGLFGVCHGGTHIKNLTIDNSCKIINAGNNKCISALIGCINANSNENGIVTIENVGNEMNMEVGTGQGSADCGTLLGHDYSSSLNVKIINCYNTGNVTGWESAAFTGWTPRVTVINSWNTGRIKSYQNYNYGYSNSLVRGNSSVTIIDSYDLNATNDETTEGVSSHNWRPNKDTNNGYPSEEYTSEWLSNGKYFASLFAYTNPDNNVDGSVWRMYFDTDDATKSHPVLYGNKIAMREDCTNKMIENKEYDVTLYRTIKAGVWNTFCAPFAVPTSQFTKVVELDVSKTDNEVLHFITASTIEAGKAYLVKTDNAIGEINASNVTVSPTITPSTAGGYAFTGVYSPTSLPQDAYVFTTKKENGQDTGKDVIIKVNAGTNMNGFRAYLKATNSNARARSFVIDEDGTTGIITATGDVIENGKMYNLGGQRVKEPQRGLYIVNGKKYIK